jgi:hypothetical protein
MRPLVLGRILGMTSSLIAALLAYIGYTDFLRAIGLSAGRTIAAHIFSLVLSALVVLLLRLGRSDVAYPVIGLGVGLSFVFGVQSINPSIVALLIVLSSSLSVMGRVLEARSPGVASRSILTVPGVFVTVVVEASTYAILWFTAAYTSWLLGVVYVNVFRPQPKIPGLLGEVWASVSQSLTVKLATALALLALIYYVGSRVIAPLLYALTVKRESLISVFKGLILEEAETVLRRRAWYHRMLGITLNYSGSIIVAVFTYALVESTYTVAFGPGGLGSILALASSTIAIWVFRGITNRVYTVSINWKRVLYMSLMLLCTYAIALIILGASTRTVASMLYYPIIGGQAPITRLDDTASLILLRVEARTVEVLEGIEDLLRLVVGLFWG